MKTEREKFLRNEAKKQEDRYFRTGKHPNGARNRHGRHGTRKRCISKPRKRARCKAKRRAH